LGSAGDFLFCASSLSLAVFFGAALGNVVRGVRAGFERDIFFEPLGPISASPTNTGILDWYHILVGHMALLALMMHGGIWVQVKTSGEVSARAGDWRGGAWWGVVTLTAVVTAFTFRNSAV